MRGTVEAFATQPHYWHHLGPVVRALRGRGTGCRICGCQYDDEGPATAPRGDGAPVLVASGPDTLAVPSQRWIAHLGHGAGQSYSGAGTPNADYGYTGGADLERVDLFLCARQSEADAWSARYPDAAVEVVGSPGLDDVQEVCRLRALRAPHRPLVAFAFHWPSTVAPEAGSAFGDWKREVERVARDTRWRTVGHWHPRWPSGHERWWVWLPGVGTMRDWRAMRPIIDLLVCDNSSIMYEAAACGIPVLALNGSRYRRDVEHGLRFWSHVPGPMLDPGDDLRAAVEAVLDDPSEALALGERAARFVYPLLDGRAAERAAVAVERSIG